MALFIIGIFREVPIEINRLAEQGMTAASLDFPKVLVLLLTDVKFIVDGYMVKDNFTFLIYATTFSYVVILVFGQNGLSESVTYKKDSKYGSHGTARLLTKREIKNKFSKDKLGFFMGSTKKKNKSYQIGQDAIYHAEDNIEELNSQIIMFGPPGSKKTTGYELPNIFHIPDAYLRETGELPDLIITDPKSEMFSLTADYLEKMGYGIRVLDFLHLKYGDANNPMDAIESEKDIMEIANGYVMSQEEGAKDLFWANAEKLVLSALIGFVKQVYKPHQQTFKRVAKLITSPEVSDPEKAITFFERNGVKGKPVDDWKLFMSTVDSDRVRANIVLGLGIKLMLFSVSGINRITSTTTFDINKLGTDKRLSSRELMELDERIKSEKKLIVEVDKTIGILDDAIKALASDNGDFKETYDKYHAQLINAEKIKNENSLEYYECYRKITVAEEDNKILKQRLKQLELKWSINVFRMVRTYLLNKRLEKQYSSEIESNSKSAIALKVELKPLEEKKEWAEVEFDQDREKFDDFCTCNEELSKRYNDLLNKMQECEEKIQYHNSNINVLKDRKDSKPVALFMLMSDSDKTFMPIINIMISSMIKAMYKTAYKTNNKLPRKVYCLWDEFANIGKISNIVDTLSTMRGRGIRPMLILQSIPQLKNRYPDAWEDIISQCDTRIYLGVNDQTTAKYCSEALGNTTIKSENISYEDNGVMGQKKSSKSEGHQSRPLKFPDELMRMKSNKMIIHQRGTDPYELEKVQYRYWEDENKLSKQRSIFDFRELPMVLDVDSLDELKFDAVSPDEKFVSDERRLPEEKREDFVKAPSKNDILKDIEDSKSEDVKEDDGKFDLEIDF